MNGEKHEFVSNPDVRAAHGVPLCLTCDRMLRSCKRHQRDRLERHRFTFEGATSLLARHLIDDHGVKPLDVSPMCTGVSQGDWVALDNIHKAAHEREAIVAEKDQTVQHGDLLAAANRVKGFVRARQLLSNVDPQEVASVHIMLPGQPEPTEFDLLSSDLEMLAAAALSAAPRFSLFIDSAEEVLSARVREVIVEEGGTCEHTNDDGPNILVDVNGVSDAIARKLTKEWFV